MVSPSMHSDTEAFLTQQGNAAYAIMTDAHDNHAPVKTIPSTLGYEHTH